jgi:hypothetical protein
LDVKKQDFVDIPLFELTSFVIYEINKVGLEDMIIGSSAIRYSDRYAFENIDYTDNSKELIANMKANNGIYENDILSLQGDVTYSREDGFTLETTQAVYDKKTSVATISANYVAHKDDNEVRGSSAEYDNSLKKSKSKNVTVKYQIRENK